MSTQNIHFRDKIRKFPKIYSQNIHVYDKIRKFPKNLFS